MGSNDGRIEHLDKMRRFAKRREGFEEGHEDTALAQAPKTFPVAIPETEFCGQGAPSDVVDREIMKRFEKLTVVAALVTPPRATSSTSTIAQSSSVILVSMVGPPQADHP
jgi:hypothetical protein